ncbi:MAG: Gfo/Idh/MocA family oxidoreductase [Oscillospiraceae bacterium]|jgi:predicted dehydrogenase|nr:Gfo/Idh/MocA family oxidoreductase [Oscillospiraceae bacterium]
MSTGATVSIGVIGLGNMGMAHAKNIADGKVPGLTLAAVASRRPAHRDWCRDNWPDAAFFESGEALIQSGACEAVLIATQHSTHPALAVEALGRDLHVLIEKPAGVHVGQARGMNEAAAHSRGAFAIMYNQRANPLYQEMRRLVTGGELGRMKRVNWIITDWYRTQSYYDSAAWRSHWAEEGGGVLLNQSPHQLDLLQWICGMPDRVRAFCHSGKWHDIEVEDDVTAYLEYPGGATGVFVTSTADAPGTNRFEVTMEGGKLLCEHGKLTIWRLAQNERDFCKTAPGGFDTPPAVQEEYQAPPSQEHVGILKAFAAHILRGEPLIAAGQEGLHGLELANAMYLSSWLGQTVTLPLDEKLYLRELNKRMEPSRAKQRQGK